MVQRRVHIKPATSPEDLAAIAEILERVSGFVTTVAELEHDGVIEPDRALLLAWEDGHPVGSGLGKRSITTGALYTMVRVVPEARRHGIGQALYEALSAHGRHLGLQDMYGRVHGDDEASLAFVTERGFREFSREVESILTLTGDPAPDPPAGIEITTLAARPDLADAARAVDAEAVPDIPAAADFTPLEYDRWHALHLEGPGALPHLCTVALAGDEVVGYSGLLALAGQPGTAENLLTGVKRAWRGRGIATALKATQAALAHQDGFERISTYNDEVNAPMRAVNTRLGFVPQPPKILVRGPFA